MRVVVARSEQENSTEKNAHQRHPHGQLHFFRRSTNQTQGDTEARAPVRHNLSPLSPG
jgi:hypothetical protein